MTEAKIKCCSLIFLNTIPTSNLKAKLKYHMKMKESNLQVKITKLHMSLTLHGFLIEDAPTQNSKFQFKFSDDDEEESFSMVDQTGYGKVSTQCDALSGPRIIV